MRSLFIFLFSFASPLFANGYSVLGLGAPCLDYVIKAEEKDLARYGLKKGGSIEIDADTLASILHDNTSLVFSGGCVANTIKGMATLGISCALTGKVGNDQMGAKIGSIFQEVGVTAFFTQSTYPTTQIACLVTPDGERSFCSCAKTEREISEKELNPAHFKEIRLAYLSGYRLLNGSYIEKSFRLAKEAGALVSFDLADSSIVDKYRERLWATIPAYVDILFANEEEAYSLVGLPPKRAAAFLKNFCKIAIVKVGSNGCWISSKEGIFHSPGVPTQTVDTTGAGDLFAAGFLYAYLKGKPLPACAYLGNLAGSAAVERHGAELSAERWSRVLSDFEKSYGQ
ncbi:MAG: adenosine kinase [Chlamydiales bacterium]|nr:adenosine kinase [Chlamydiales bacterium]